MDKLKQLQQNPVFAKYQFIIFPAFSIAISLFLLIFIIFGQISNSLKQQTEIADLQKKVESLTQKNSELEKIDDSSYQEYLDTALVALPEEKDIAGAIGQVLFILQSNSLNLDNLTFSNVSPEGNLQTFQIRLEIQGAPEDIENLIGNLKNIPRIVQLSDIEISSSRNSKRSQSSVTLKTYFQQHPTKIGSIEEPLVKPSSQDLQLLSSIREKIGQTPLSNSQDATGPKGKQDPFN